MFNRVALAVLTIVAISFGQFTISGHITGPTAPGLSFKLTFKGTAAPQSIVATQFNGVDYEYAKGFTVIWRGSTTISAVTPGYKFSPDSFPNDTLGYLGNGAYQTAITHNFQAIDTAKPTITNISITNQINLGDSVTLKYTQLDNSNIIGARKIYIGYGTTWALIDSIIKNTADGMANALDTFHANHTLKYAPIATGLFKMKIVLSDKENNSVTAYSDSFKVIPKGAPIFHYTKKIYTLQKTPVTVLDSIMLASVVGPVDSFVLTPSGVDGLSINSAGLITGTVSKASQVYIIKGYNAAGSSADTITIKFSIPVINPPVFTYTKVLYTVGTIMTVKDSIMPASIIGQLDSFTLTATGYDIKSLTIDKKSGLITGSVPATPNQVFLTIRGINAGGYTEVTIKLVVTSTSVGFSKGIATSKISISGRSINSLGAITAELYNFKGQLIKKQSGKNSLMIPELCYGTYVLKVQTEKEKLTRTLFVR